jgi:DNA-binding transcriptional regulator YiaG
MNKKNRIHFEGVATRPYPWRCGNCGRKAVEPARVNYEAHAVYEGRSVCVTISDLEAPRCRECGEMLLDDAANQRISQVIRHELNLLEPSQIRANLAALGLTQKAFAAQLGVAPETVSRWISGGMMQSRLADKAMRWFFGIPGVREAASTESEDQEFGHAVSLARTLDDGSKPRVEQANRPIRLSRSFQPETYQRKEQFNLMGVHTN